jgi:hypothetical protein
MRNLFLFFDLSETSGISLEGDILMDEYVWEVRLLMWVGLLLEVIPSLSSFNMSS